MAAPVDKWATQNGSVVQPATSGEAITKSDTANFAQVSRGIYVGGTGDVVVVFADDVALTFSAVPAGTLLPVRAKRVNSTSTTATLMLALY